MKVVYFDLETGGLELEHPIIQLAAIAVDDSGKELEGFERKLQFRESDADPAALKINHYDPAVWKESAIPIGQFCQEFGVFLNRYAEVPMTSKKGRPYRVCQLSGYNAATFDAPRLQKLFRDQDLFLPASYRVLDALQLVLWHFHLIGEYHEHLRLADACELLGIRLDGAHDALADIRATVEIVRRLSGRDE